MPQQPSKFLTGGEGIQSTAKGDQSFHIRSVITPIVAPAQTSSQVPAQPVAPKAVRYGLANPLKAYTFATDVNGLQPSTNAQLSVAPGQAAPMGTIRTVGGSNKNK